MTATIKPVTIPREVADAIEWFRADMEGSVAYTNQDVVTVALREPYPLNHREAALRKVPFDTLLSALVNGYERELTEEEKREQAYAEIKRQYVSARSTTYYISDTDGLYSGILRGIEITLDTLRIVIPGINDEKGGAA